jgi:hypothetical protein
LEISAIYIGLAHYGVFFLTSEEEGMPVKTACVISPESDYDAMMKCPKILVAALLMLPMNAIAFPEIPFCPIGGPPGWYNRMVDNDRYYPPPPAYYPLPVAPAYRGYPVYSGQPVSPVQATQPVTPKQQ